MLANGFGNGAENNALFRQFGPIGGGDRNTVKNGVNRNHAGQCLLLFQRNAEFFISFQKFRIDFVQTLGRRLLFGRRVIAKTLIIDFIISQLGPRRLFHRLPELISFQTPVQQPVRLAFFAGNQTDNVFIQSHRHRIGINVRHKAVFIFVAALVNDLGLLFAAHSAFPKF